MRLEWIPFVGFIVYGVRVHRATRAIARANREGRLVPGEVLRAWELHGRLGAALIVTLCALWASVLVGTVAGWAWRWLS